MYIVLNKKQFHVTTYSILQFACLEFWLGIYWSIFGFLWKFTYIFVFLGFPPATVAAYNAPPSPAEKPFYIDDVWKVTYTLKALFYSRDFL